MSVRPEEEINLQHSTYTALCPTWKTEGGCGLWTLSTCELRAKTAHVIRTKWLRGRRRSPGLKTFTRESLHGFRTGTPGGVCQPGKEGPSILARASVWSWVSPRSSLLGDKKLPYGSDLNTYGCPSMCKLHSNLSWNFGVEETAFASCDRTRTRRIIHRTGSILKGLH